MIDREFVVRQNLVDRYLRDELTEEENEAFEIFYLDDPETQLDLEIAQALIESIDHRRPKPRRKPLFWLVAALSGATAMLGLTTATLLYELSELRSPAAVESHYLDALRSDDERPSIARCPGRWITVIAPGTTLESSETTVRLTGADGRRVTIRARSVDGLVPIVLRSDRLPAGATVVEVPASGDDPNSISGFELADGDC
ncbi:MAG: hypothetical protein AAGA95_00525 [Pseudomonadota bacterium]